MAEICCGVVSEAEASSTCKPSSRAARRRRMEIRRFKIINGLAQPHSETTKRRRLVGDRRISSCSDGDDKLAMEGFGDERSSEEEQPKAVVSMDEDTLSLIRVRTLSRTRSSPAALELRLEHYPRFGVASVCGRRRDMEDTVAVHPSFLRNGDEPAMVLHYFGVYDGHGCSHVAVRCRERMHELVREELGSACGEAWREAMQRSFVRMDKEVIAWNESVVAVQERCRCELQSPECDAVGSTAVVAVVTPDKIVVANCGDSRAVLSRKGKAVPLSDDHKPDRPDELNRIEEAGGRVIYWDGPRVLGVLAMSRAIGDNYLKPYVSCEPEVTIIDRTPDDDCLILASDGLWDVVSNDTACGVVRMCLRGKMQAPREGEDGVASSTGERGDADRACTDASMLLTKLALARHSTDNVSVVVVDLRWSGSTNTLFQKN